MSRIKPVFKCDIAKKQLFSQSQCLLTISVGQEVHEGEKLQTVVELVNESFDSCILMIDDSLQRHSMAIDGTHDADIYYPISIQQGDAWLTRNKAVYEKLGILKSIVRWDHWLKHNNAPYWHDQINKLMATNPEYKNAFVSTVDEFLRRYCRRNLMSEAQLRRAEALCMDYLKEECVAMCLWPELDCQFEVYPSERNLAMSTTHSAFVLRTYPDLLHAVAIKFKNRKQLKPQVFITNEM